MASFVPNPAGFVEVCKSPGMRGALAAAAENIAERANAIAIPNPEVVHIWGWKKAPYASRVDTLDYTCVGVAFARNSLARRFEAKRKALSGQNH